ncbi:MAG: hypothetical protein A2X80_09865 [Geobacteraceae bacterium GWB2_52_12]|nr:MAG: hypothetical protein A2X80_09865 [Geobacteraceae bacterium GWB2_52_12]
MAPMSILPGRVRFEDKRLFGNRQLSRHLETTIAAVPGVLLISSSHRTGRILVEFNEGQLTRDDLVARIKETLACEIPVPEKSAPLPTAPTSPKGPSFFSGSMLADVALHLLLPAPLDLLLPAIGPTHREQASP